MSDSLRRQAEARLSEALRETRAQDPREHYRSLLRDLKQRSHDDYDQMVADFQESVVKRIAEEGADPLVAWLQFGTKLAERLHPGRDVVIDDTGRATALTGPPSWSDLILHLPDDRRARGVVIGLPPALSRSQRASVELLARGSVRMPDP